MLRTSAHTRLGLERLLRDALALYDAQAHRACRPPRSTARSRTRSRRTRRRCAASAAPRFFYATQIEQRPFTVLVFMNDPSLIARNYHRYLESFMRRRFGIRSAPVRVRLRGRREAESASRKSADPTPKPAKIPRA